MHKIQTCDRVIVIHKDDIYVGVLDMLGDQFYTLNHAYALHLDIDWQSLIKKGITDEMIAIEFPHQVALSVNEISFMTLFENPKRTPRKDKQ